MTRRGLTLVRGYRNKEERRKKLRRPPGMSEAEHRWSDLIFAEMRKDGIYKAIETGKPDLIAFRVVLGNHGFVQTIDLGGVDSKDERTKRVHRAYQRILKERLDLDAIELLKVAQCPKCLEWFATVEERNDHRKTVHGPKAEEASHAR